MEFKDRLKSLRIKNGLSQAILADMLDVSSSLIGLYETGKRKPFLCLFEIFFAIKKPPAEARGYEKREKVYTIARRR